MSGIMQSMANSNPKIIPTPQPIFNLDAANYSAVPLNNSRVDGTGLFGIAVVNPTGSITWNGANGGVFRVTSAAAANNTTNFFAFGPNYSLASNAYTVGMAYKWNGGVKGRLLNSNSANTFNMGLNINNNVPADIMMNSANTGVQVGSFNDIADTNWHFIWVTCSGTTSDTRSKSYIATRCRPTRPYGISNTNFGFSSLRLWGKRNASSTIVDPVDADVSFVKIWNVELSLQQIQAEYTRYAPRFGY